MRVAEVTDDQWPVVGWLWQAFRNDLAQVIGVSLPRPDGRYKHDRLDVHPGPGLVGYLAWAPHPEVGEEAPVGFALVSGLDEARRTVQALWTAPGARRAGAGRRLALDVIGRHPGPWTIAFQHHNTGAAAFWRVVAEAAFGPDGWSEEQRPVPGRPAVPPDHWIDAG